MVNQMLDDYAATAKPVPWMRPPGLLDVASEPRFRGLSAEEIYALMQQDKQHEEEGEKEGKSDGGKDGSGLPEPSASTSPDRSVPPSPSPDPLAAGPPEPAEPGIGDFEEPPPEPDPQPGDETGAHSGLEGDWQIASAGRTTRQDARQLPRRGLAACGGNEEAESLVA